MSNFKNITMEYKIIYADPPWIQKAGRKLKPYKVINGKQIWNSDEVKTTDLPYQTMTVEEIANIPVKNIVDKDAFLFMWVTNKYLLQAEKVIKAWGFEYVACITWRKKKMGGGLGGVVRISSEYLLFCRRGNLKAIGTIPESVIEAKRPYVNGYPCHSKKPDVFAEIIESVSPPGKRLEMFARNHRDGWDVFGNEVENSIEINH
jgi:site-specific DNA-methyltransferase (adenine-specific)